MARTNIKISKTQTLRNNNKKTKKLLQLTTYLDLCNNNFEFTIY